MGDRAQQPDGLAHLLQIGGAAVALGQMRLEQTVLLGSERPFQVIGDQLDELFAANLIL